MPWSGARLAIKTSSASFSTAPSCSTGSPWSATISYIGTEYERALYGTVYYNHTLPPNWNRKSSTTQQYNCGDTSISYFHVSASSFHTGGVNLVMADGSVRFVRDSVDFAAWQAAVVALALLIGVATGNVAAQANVTDASQLDIFSPETGLAPSTLLLGGRI